MSRTDSPASVPPSSSTSSKEAEAAERERLVETLLRSEFDQDPSAQQEREEVRRALRSSTNALVHATVRDYGRVAVLGGAALGAAVGFVGALALITRRRTVPFTGRAVLIGVQAFAASLVITGVAGAGAYLGLKRYLGVRDVNSLAQIEELAEVLRAKVTPASNSLREALPVPQRAPPPSSPASAEDAARERAELRELWETLDKLSAQTYTPSRDQEDQKR